MVEDIERSFTEWARKEDFISLQHNLIPEDIQAIINHQLQPGGRFQRWHKKEYEWVLKEVESILMSKVDGM